MSTILHAVQNEKADFLKLKSNIYTLVQIGGEEKLNKISLNNFLKKEGFNPLNITSTNSHKKIKLKGGKNKVTKSRPKKFLVTLPKTENIQPNDKNIV
jgi:hypothetical protein